MYSYQTASQRRGRTPKDLNMYRRIMTLSTFLPVSPGLLRCLFHFILTFHSFLGQVRVCGETVNVTSSMLSDPDAAGPGAWR